jgi:hypothetical protein
MELNILYNTLLFKINKNATDRYNEVLWFSLQFRIGVNHDILVLKVEVGNLVKVTLEPDKR